MLEIQARCELLRLTVQLVYTSKPEVYVTHNNSTTTITAHKIYSLITKHNQLILLTEIIPVYFENHVALIGTLYEQNAEFLILYRVVYIVTTVV